jgi:hypothetical protein
MKRRKVRIRASREYGCLVHAVAFGCAWLGSVLIKFWEKHTGVFSWGALIGGSVCIWMVFGIYWIVEHFRPPHE